MWMESEWRDACEDATCEAIAAAAGACAAERDADGCFPAAAFAGLRRLGLVARPLAGGDAAFLMRVLAAVGQGNLSVGRIFEGHVNAHFLIQQFGTTRQRERARALASIGKLFGVWNTDMPGEAVTLDAMRLCGRKSFASGIDGLSHAVITAAQPQGRLMIIAPVAGLPVDRSWWRPFGMQASGSHVVDLTGVKVEPDWILGRPDDYIKEPWFSAGAIRFVAVHVGGMHAVLDAAVSHLRRTDRTDDPHQRHRIGRMAIAVEAGYAWLDRAASLWTEAAELGAAAPAQADIVTVANAARCAVESLALTVLEEAERSVGAAGMIAPHPLERLIRDLRIYLRQPNPDGALAAVGAALAEGGWVPGRPL